MRKVGSEYVVHEVLGTGATGEVWSGTDGQGNPVAVKILRAEYSSRRDVVRRFIQERDLLTEIDHPRVVRVHDLVYDRSTLAIVMDLIDGADLAALLHEVGALDTERMRSIARDVAMGLAAIHAADIVHLDLKPGNVLLSRGEGRERALIADLGVSQLATGPAGVAEHPRFGTPQYTAPEVVTGGSVGSAADVYALGLLMLEMGRGHPAIDDGSDVLGILDAQVSEVFSRPDGIDDNTWLIIDEMLDKDPDARPTAREAAIALGAADEELDISVLHGAESDPGHENVDRPLFPEGAAAPPPTPTARSGAATRDLGHHTSFLRSAQTTALDSVGPRTMALPASLQEPRSPDTPEDPEHPPVQDGGSPRRRPIALIITSSVAALSVLGLVLGAVYLLPGEREPEPTTEPTTTPSSSAASTSVSIPPDAIVVPDLAGKSEQVARGELHGGLRVTTVPVPGTAANDGTVLTSDPIAGSPVYPGDTITLHVAREVASQQLDELQATSSSGSTAQEPVTAGGTTSPSSLVLSGPQGIAETQFPLQGRYLRLEGAVTVPDGADEAQVQVSLDQVVVVDETIPAGSSIPLELDVTEGDRLTVRVTTSEGGPAKAALTDAVLYGEKGRIPGS